MNMKLIDNRRVYTILEDYINNIDNDIDDRVLIYRFLNKLSDTEEFELKVNKEFSAYKIKTYRDKIENELRERVQIDLLCGFSLRPYNTSNWQLYLNDELFLDSLDFKIARRIAFDINVAFSIKSARVNKQK